ncbi:hypothetical protein [Vibrio comitans]|uniref:Uncharacterized protein n=1 Tax=Vibrio comitans NBRC 102076 TaxID=1219078 RepID=A0A4Y3IRL1_9VIBR|nr:hypothetical protein [Vibrio comitans]GEA61458.1 hypothetical protein VCO01S_26510 [Vibrio comitans NBRC 102076]
MKKLLAVILIHFSSYSFASIEQDSESGVIDFITETFDISVSNSDFLGDYSSDYVFTLNASYNINETWRVFGSLDTDEFLDVGVGYSFFIAERVYNEVSVSVGGNTDKTYVTTVGLFSATQWNDFVFYTNFEGQYIENNPDIPNLDVQRQQIFFNKLVGTNYEVTQWLSLSASYGHDQNHYDVISVNDFKFTAPIEGYADSYVNLGFILNLWGVKPYIAYRFDLNESEASYWDFSLSFDF